MSPNRSRECCRKTFAWEPNAYGGESYVCRHAENCPVAGVRRCEPSEEWNARQRARELFDASWRVPMPMRARRRFMVRAKFVADHERGTIRRRYNWKDGPAWGVLQ